MTIRNTIWTQHTLRFLLYNFLKIFIFQVLRVDEVLLKVFFQKSKPAKEEVELTRTQSLPMKVFFLLLFLLAVSILLLLFFCCCELNVNVFVVVVVVDCVDVLLGIVDVAFLVKDDGDGDDRMGLRLID